MPREGKGREIWGLYSRESRETGIPAHPWFYCSLLFLLFLFLFFKYRNFCCSLFVFTIALYFQLTALTLLTGCPSPLSTVTMQAPQPPSLQETLSSDVEESLKEVKMREELQCKHRNWFCWKIPCQRFNSATLTFASLNFASLSEQSWKMSNLLHGPISTNQILPREKRVNRDIFGTSNLQNRTYGVSCDE